MTPAVSSPAVLHQAGRVVTGAGCLLQLPGLIASWKPERLLLVVGRAVTPDSPVHALHAALTAAGIDVLLLDPVPPEPEVADVDAVLAAARQAGPVDLVVGVGGGSAIDVAKAVAVLLAHPVSVRELLSGTPVPGRGLPTVMVPTTAGTGAEATPNSIILVPQDALKVGIVSPHLLPDLVLLDPLLTLTLPPAVTAHTGIDALCHAIECYTSKKANLFSDLYGLEAIRLISRSIRRAFADGQDVAARQDMLLGSYYGGVCIATSSTTAVHALAYPLGGRYRVPHGLSNAMLLPAIMAYNCVGNEARFAAMARAMDLPVAGLSDAQATTLFVQALARLNADLGITTRLSDLGVTEADLDALVDGASKVTRLLDNNPRPMGRDDMRALYAAVL
ncbi:alcohol dehydrogenase class IV [Sphaerotilus hippei]|uniref:Alcohol dehydrogenase class IV n=1 Tax=Sphaerotilus hippei TaxID=744406 RepID=A0A318H5X2_9BURK|nr:iron-containing alcohol dehydrogenase [Sphaerotilus hippei]PXW99340.1 alcohol dehydrogenase class IV [Sphaerotilus hippei]